MSELETNNNGIVPIAKRYSLLESPDTGERWPERFDAITIEQQAARYFKAREARRQLDHFFDIPLKREPNFLHGVVWHFPNNDNQSVVMFDTNSLYSRTVLLISTVLGNPMYGYSSVGQIDTLSGEENFKVNSSDYLTYLKAPRDFEPVAGEVLGMMISVARGQVLEHIC